MRTRYLLLTLTLCGLLALTARPAQTQDDLLTETWRSYGGERKPYNAISRQGRNMGAWQDPAFNHQLPTREPHKSKRRARRQKNVASPEQAAKTPASKPRTGTALNATPPPASKPVPTPAAPATPQSAAPLVPSPNTAGVDAPLAAPRPTEGPPAAPVPIPAPSASAAASAPPQQ